MRGRYRERLGTMSGELVPVVEDMTEAEAREVVNAINAAGESIRDHLAEMYARKGWRSLGYKSWRDMAKAEFPDWKQSALYYQLSAALIARGIEEMPDTEPTLAQTLKELPESHFRPLAKLGSALEQRIAVQLAFAAASKVMQDGEPTGALIEEAVETVQEIIATKGQVDTGDGTMTAAEASVIVKHNERVQRAIDRAKELRGENGHTPPPAAQNGGGPKNDQFTGAACRVVSVAGRQVTFLMADDAVAQAIADLWRAGATDLLMDLARRVKGG